MSRSKEKFLGRNHLTSVVGGLAYALVKNQQKLKEVGETATRDPLTGLLNRAGYIKAKQNIRPVLALDVDCTYLHSINNSLGHKRGDDLLIATARILQSITRPEDIVARTGGDEFRVIFGEPKPTDVRDTNPTDLQERRSIAHTPEEKLLHSVMDRFEERKKSVFSHYPDLVEAGADIAVGAVICEPDWTVEQLDEAVEQANHAMLQAKSEQHQRNLASGLISRPH